MIGIAKVIGRLIAVCCDCARKLSVDLDHEYKEEEEVYD